MTDVFGVSGRLMLHALIEGISTPMTVAALAKGRLRKKVVDLAQALDGRLDDHHRFLLQLQLRRLGQEDTDLATLGKHFDEALPPYPEQCQAVQQVPGVSRVVSPRTSGALGAEMTVVRS